MYFIVGSAAIKRVHKLILYSHTYMLPLDQRGVLCPNPGVCQSPEAGHGEAERERRRHRAGTPARRLRLAHHRSPRARAQVSMHFDLELNTKQKMRSEIWSAPVSYLKPFYSLDWNSTHVRVYSFYWPDRLLHFTAVDCGKIIIDILYYGLWSTLSHSWIKGECRILNIFFKCIYGCFSVP